MAGLGSLSTSAEATIGGNTFGAPLQRRFHGRIDEVVIYNRALSAQEVEALYHRGVLRMGYQVRSCDDPDCDTELFVGPDGTVDSFYSELDNSTPGLPRFDLTQSDISSNRYFQWRAYMSSDSDSVGHSPKLRDMVVEHR